MVRITKILFPLDSLISHAKTASGGEHARCDIHACQLLEEQLRRIRYLDLGDLGLIVARAAFVQALFDLSII